MARISRGFYLTFSTLGCGERHTVPTVDETVPLTPDAPRHGPWLPGQRTARIVRSPSPRSGGLRGITHPPRGHAEDAAPGLRVARAPRASGIVGSGVRPALVAQDAAAGVRLWRACRAYPRARAEEFLTGAATSGTGTPHRNVSEGSPVRSVHTHLCDVLHTPVWRTSGRNAPEGR